MVDKVVVTNGEGSSGPTSDPTIATVLGVLAAFAILFAVYFLAAGRVPFWSPGGAQTPVTNGVLNGDLDGGVGGWGSVGGQSQPTPPPVGGNAPGGGY